MKARVGILRVSMLLISITGAFIMIPRIEFDNSLQSWIPPNSQIIQDYRNFLEDFQSDAFILIAMWNPGGYGKAQFEKIVEDVIRDIRQIENVKSVGKWPPPFLRYKTVPVEELHAIYLIFDPPSHLNPNRPELITELESVLEGTGIEFHMVGTGVIHKAINDTTSRASLKYLVVSVLLLTLLLALFVRDPGVVLKTIAIAVGSVAFVILSACLLKVKFNVVMSILPCLILFYSTSVSIHILNHQGDLKKVIQPTLIAVLTTCAGFAVFMFDRSPLLRDFGLLAVIGLAAGLIWAVIFYYPVRSDKIIILPIRQKLNHVKRYWNKWVLISSIILTGLCIPGILRIRAEIDVRSSLPPTNKAIQDYRFVEGRLGPYMPVEYLVDIKGTDMESLKRWTDEVYGFEEVGAVMSFQAIPAMIYPGTGFISRDGSKGRIVFYVPVLSTTEGLMLVKRMNELAEKDFPPSSPLPQPTGHISLYVSVAEHLASSFRRSLILAFFLVFIIIGVYLRNLRLFLVSIIPNILPVAAILGIMGWLRIPLDMVTMPMGCMALGIIVDDTVHILYWYRKTTDTDLAFENAGPGTILTSLIYIIGFCVFLTSGIYPVRYFGILLITAMATAFVGDIMLLPYLLKSQVQKRISSQTRSNHEI